MRVRQRRWFPFQPVNTVMAPCGHLHFHPGSKLYRDDFAQAPRSLQGLFLHEMTHVWQAQLRGRYWLPLMRHPFCRYGYTITPGKPFERYGIEQQAEIMRDLFVLRSSGSSPGKPPVEVYEALVPFVPND
ncbi:vgr related protein [Novosphingobium sp. Leaf2]|uniref:vgr related protein n=1 Tax=Novosphingobium sp. Leaf2 TaxID=1735670 RepID=UPI001F3581FC|nr:vgr related protein [Novosphingobium sp. Leaf2]